MFGKYAVKMGGGWIWLSIVPSGITGVEPSGSDTRTIFTWVVDMGKLFGAWATVTSGSQRSRRKSWPRLAENIYLRFYFWMQFKSCSRVHCASYLNFRLCFKFSFVDKWLISWSQMCFEWLIESLSISYNCDVTHMPGCLPIPIQ
jgi:hypothetical protein